MSNNREEKSKVDNLVAEIIQDIRLNGDEALIKYTSEYDEYSLSLKNMFFSDSEIKEAYSKCEPRLISALEDSSSRIFDYHKRQMPKNLIYEADEGVTLGYRWTSLKIAGLYIPAGTAPLFSSVLMNAIPARVAGVEEIIATIPTPRGKVMPEMLAACLIAGVDKVLRVGGAQAVAALAYGTESITPVDIIAGPGNIYVSSAKKQVFGKVAIDMIAGPSEVTVVSDNKNNSDWIAADLLAQAEHDESSQSILITDDEIFSLKVQESVNNQIKMLKRSEIATKSWERNGLIIVVKDMKEVPEIVNLIAPEHLELAVENPNVLMEQIHNAGAIFLGRFTPEAIGDYVAGPSHVLPTSGTSRFSSGLSVMNFLKRTSLVGCSPVGLRKVGQNAITMAEAEGLDAHARSISIRTN